MPASGPSATGPSSSPWRRGWLIALFAAVAADLAQLIPPVLLLAIAGLALVPALVAALKAISEGPLVLGPLFAFAIALSDMTILGLGPFFWSLVVGTAISSFLERDGMKELRAAGEARRAPRELTLTTAPRSRHSGSTRRVPRTDG